jgi:hypothetical protein
MKFCKKCNVDTERTGRGVCKICKSKQDAKLYAENAEIKKKKSAAWRMNNPDKAREVRDKWQKANKDKVCLSVLRWKNANPLAMAAMYRTRRARKYAGGKHTAEDIIQLLKLQKYKCPCCRVSLKAGYHVDHIIPLVLGGTNKKGNLQILCPTCNLQKSAKHPVEFMQSRGYLI